MSYGRRDAQDLADRLSRDLSARGYDVWQDSCEIRAGREWEQQITDGLRSTQVVVALLSPHAVRVRGLNNENADSVCLDELSFARFSRPSIPIVPAMALSCEPPFCIFRLDYVDLCNWNRSGEAYDLGLRRLLASIEATLRGEVRHRFWESQLRPWDFAAYLHGKERNFCGREWLVEELDAWRVSHAEPALLITGEPGSGKSALVAHLAHTNPGGQVLACYCCQAETPATLEPATFVRTIAAMIASKLVAYSLRLEDPAIREVLEEAACQADPASSFERGILSPLEELHAPEEGVRYLLIDALDEALLHKGPVNIVEVLAPRIDQLPGWLRIVATTRRDPAIMKRLQGIRTRPLDALDERNLKDIDRFIDSRLQSPNLAERLTASSLTGEQVRSTLRLRSNGNFLYVQQALEGIERDVYSIDQLDALPPGLAGLYTRSFARRWRDKRQFAGARQIFEIAVAAQEPLTEQQLAAVTSFASEEQLLEVLNTLEVYVPRRTDADDKDTYAIYHNSLADWLTDRGRRGETHYASARSGHERLASYCWDRFVDKGAALSGYPLAHLPSHLAEAGRWDNLERVLGDETYRQVKVDSGMAAGLVGDFAKALKTLPPDWPATRTLALLKHALHALVLQLMPVYVGAADSEELVEFKKSALFWRGYLLRLVEAGTELETSVRQELGFWFRTMGDLHVAADEFELSFEFYQVGVSATADEDAEHRRCKRALGEAKAMHAFKNADKKAPHAHDLCDRVRNEGELSLGAWLMLSRTYVLLEEFGLAEEACRNALSQIGELGGDSRGDDRQRVHAMIGLVAEARNGARAGALIAKAHECVENRRLNEAIALLDEAVTTAPTEPIAYLLRCRCHLQMNAPEAARADLDRFRQYVTGAQIITGAEAIEALEKSVSCSEESLRTFGEAGMRLRNEAVAAFHADDFSVAVDCLRQALSKCARKGVGRLRRELSIALNASAVKMANTPAAGRPMVAQERALRDAAVQLQEACELDAENAVVADNLKNVRLILLALEELTRKYGTLEVVEFLQQAAAAYQKNCGDEAIALFRKAIIASGGRAWPAEGGGRIPAPHRRFSGDTDGTVTDPDRNSNGVPRPDTPRTPTWQRRDYANLHRHAATGRGGRSGSEGRPTAVRSRSDGPREQAGTEIAQTVAKKGEAVVEILVAIPVNTSRD